MTSHPHTVGIFIQLNMLQSLIHVMHMIVQVMLMESFLNMYDIMAIFSNMCMTLWLFLVTCVCYKNGRLVTGSWDSTVKVRVM